MIWKSINHDVWNGDGLTPADSFVTSTAPQGRELYTFMLRSRSIYSYCSLKRSLILFFRILNKVCKWITNTEMQKKEFRIKKKVLVWHFLNAELLKWWNKTEMAEKTRMALLGNAISSLTVDRDVLEVLSRVFKKIDELATPRATVSSFIARFDLTCITCPVRYLQNLKYFYFIQSLKNQGESRKRPNIRPAMLQPYIWKANSPL